MARVIKRDGVTEEKFDKSKISNAIEKAMKYGSGIIDHKIAEDIAKEIEIVTNSIKVLTISQVEDMVYHKLIVREHEATAKSYEGYRAIQEHKRETNTTDDSIIGLVSAVNEEVMNENSNKNATLASTQRDLIAGEVSKDIVKRKVLPPHLVQAHESGAIHIHK